MLNRGRRKKSRKGKKARARRKAPRRGKARSKKATKKKTTGRKKKRRKTKANPSGGKKRRKKSRTSSGKKASKRRKKYSLSKTQKNPPKRRKKKRSARRNPGFNVVGALKNTFRKWTSGSFAITAAQAGLGLGLSLATEEAFARHRYTPTFFKRRGVGAVALSAASGILVSTGAVLVEKLCKRANNKLLNKACANLGTNVLLGSMICTMVKAAYEFVPGLASKARLPRMSSGGSYASAELDGMGSYGYPGQYGMGDVMGPEDMVAAESMARSTPGAFSGIGDWMGVSGIGSSGGSPIPLENIHGMGGMSGLNDWMEYTPDESFQVGSEIF